MNSAPPPFTALTLSTPEALHAVSRDQLWGVHTLGERGLVVSLERDLSQVVIQFMTPGL